MLNDEPDHMKIRRMVVARRPMAVLDTAIDEVSKGELLKT